MMNIPLIRLLNQQIISPQFTRPEEVVDWMGAVQAQDLKAAEWAIGLRTKRCVKDDVVKALAEGKILRVHVMRPTWHFVSASDIHWMLRLSRDNVERVYASFIKSLGIVINEQDYGRSMEVMRRVLEDGHSLTLDELTIAFGNSGLPATEFHVKAYVWRAESRAVVCGGSLRDGKITFMLIDKQAPSPKELTREEALARLAEKYFRSHSPATQQDFAWWSGLSMADIRMAMTLIGDKLEKAEVKGRTFYIHHDCRTRGRYLGSMTLLPPYDEYLLGYKDRTDVLPEPLYSKAFNAHGIFYRIIQQGGQIVGNWNEKKSKQMDIDLSFFREGFIPNAEAMEKAIKRYKDYLQSSFR